MPIPKNTFLRALLFTLSFAAPGAAMAEDYGYPAKYYNPGWVFPSEVATAPPPVQRIYQGEIKSSVTRQDTRRRSVRASDPYKSPSQFIASPPYVAKNN
jgi:hypothetical protein